jgi:hypothetical protein
MTAITIVTGMQTITTGAVIIMTGTGIVTMMHVFPIGDGTATRSITVHIPMHAPGYAYRQRGYLPPNGEGMIDPRDPNLKWGCDSDGHHCHWAPRF